MFLFPLLRWYRRGREVLADQYPDSGGWGSGLPGSGGGSGIRAVSGSIFISNVSREDAGVWSCHVDNGLASQEMSIQLDIFRKFTKE